MGKTDRLRVTKYRVGPGGLGCACCTRLFPTLLRRRQARAVRRAVRQELHRKGDRA